MSIHNLRNELQRYDQLAVAISGGVDSTTLAAVAHEVLGEAVMMVHAVSPAVPREATERVKLNASRFGWALTLVEAGEFTDKHYLQNPVNRCYYCKSNLYERIKQVWSSTVASGANVDDLGDYRPGLLAASEKQVVHPLIEAGIDKAAVRDIAESMQLDTVARLPAQPCLSSRIETGIAIDANDLAFVHRVEKHMEEVLGAGNHRCRITAAGVRIEFCEQLAASAGLESCRNDLVRKIEQEGRRLAGFSKYKKGSAFLIKKG